MKSALLPVLLLAACAAGCRTTRFEWDNPAQRKALLETIEEESPAPEGIPNTGEGPAADGLPSIPTRLALGFAYGNTNSVAWGRAVKGSSYRHSFSPGELWGLSLGLWTSVSLDEDEVVLDPDSNWRALLELQYQYYSMLLRQHDFHYGTLQLHAVMFHTGFYWMPEKLHPVGAHFLVEFGFAVPNFVKSAALRHDDSLNGRHTDISVGVAGTMFAFGAGIDFHLSPDSCLSLTLKLVECTAPTEWEVQGGVDPGYGDFKRLRASHTQLVLTYRYFF